MTISSPAPFQGLLSAFRLWHADIQSKIPALAKTGTRPAQGQVTLLGAGPGAADLISLRGMRALQAADVIFYDGLADAALLDFAKLGARKISVGKAPGNHSQSQPQINALLVTAAQQGQRVVRLKCGDPGIFGRGAEEAEALDAAGICWDIIPGVTAACAAAASARSFLTERGKTERVVFATGHRRAGEVSDWSACASPGTTLACYMGVSTSGELQSGLLAAGWPACCAVEVISKAQTAQERVLHGRLDGLEGLCSCEKPLNPAILLIRWPAEQGGAALATSRQLASAPGAV
ncbi:MAG: uroporphyrinogen-III C-methyltransferase [Cypionkella sp.]